MKSGNIVTVFGGTGFIGSHLIACLARDGWRIKIATRDAERASHLRLAGDLGQITIIGCDLTKPATIEQAITGSNAIVYLPGILAESRRQSFDGIHAEGARLVSELAARHNISNYVHMSALGARHQSASAYARSKAAGEAATRVHLHNSVILRPSIVFGHGDGFFTRFGILAKYLPVIPCFFPELKFQPVSVHDVCQAIQLGLSDSQFKGLTFELGGPHAFSMRDMLEMLAQTVGGRVRVMALPQVAAYGLALLTAPLPSSPLTFDQIRLMRQGDHLLSEFSPGFKQLGIQPRALAAELPSILAGLQLYGHAG
ncbi:MAG: complex I NDUFA9 subunit family protein [Pseudomonadota bacterium]